MRITKIISAPIPVQHLLLTTLHCSERGMREFMRNHASAAICLGEHERAAETRIRFGFSRDTHRDLFWVTEAIAKPSIDFASEHVHSRKEIYQPAIVPCLYRKVFQWERRSHFFSDALLITCMSFMRVHSMVSGATDSMTHRASFNDAAPVD